MDLEKHVIRHGNQSDTNDLNGETKSKKEPVASLEIGPAKHWRPETDPGSIPLEWRGHPSE